jgi:hypothetical protein
MATARDLIRLAFRRGRIIGVDQTPTAAEENEALETLNDLLDSWWNERLSVYQLVQENFPWAAGNASRTIGSGGDFATTRPVRITGAFFRSGGVDYYARIATDRAEYDGITNKTTTGRPQLVFYDPAYPLGVLYAYPVPDVAYTAYIASHKRLESFAGAAEDVDLPPGYNRLIVNGLAIELCSDFGVAVPAQVASAFATAKATIKRANSPAPVMQVPSELLRHDWDIITGEAWW